MSGRLGEKEIQRETKKQRVRSRTPCTPCNANTRRCRRYEKGSWRLLFGSIGERQCIRFVECLGGGKAEMSSIFFMPVLHPGRMTWEDRRMSTSACLPRARKKWRLGTSQACSSVMGTFHRSGAKRRVWIGKGTGNGA